MCLSNLYREKCAEENLLMRNVADVRSSEGKLIFTDLMGVRSEYEATIEKVDLMENYIIIR